MEPLQAQAKGKPKEKAIKAAEVSTEEEDSEEVSEQEEEVRSSLASFALPL